MTIEYPRSGKHPNSLRTHELSTAPSELATTSAPRFRAAAKALTLWDLDERYSLARIPQGLLLQLVLPRSTLERIVENLLLPASGATIGSAELLGAAHEEIHARGLAPTPRLLQSVRALRELSEKERRTATSALRFLRHHPAGLFTATTLAVRIIDSSGTFAVNAQPDSLSAVNRVSEILSEAKHRGPRPEHAGSWGQAVQNAEHTLREYRKVFELHAEGFGIEPIQMQTGVGTTAIRNWLRGRTPDSLDRLDRLSTNVAERAQFAIPRSASIAWAALIGAYQGGTKRHCAEHNLTLHFDDREVAERVAVAIRQQSLKAQVSESPPNSERTTWFNVPITSRSFCAALAGCTNENNAIPWEYLGSLDEKVSFLKALFVSTGTMQHGRFCFASTHHPGLVVAVAALLEQLGVPTDIHDSSRATYLKVSGTYALYRFRALGLVPQRHQIEVDQILLNKNSGSDPCTQYDAFMRLRAQQPHTTVKELATVLGISVGTAQNWCLERGVKPEAVKARARVHDRIAKFHIPYADTVPYLLRETSVSLEDAYRLGRLFPLSALTTAIQSINLSTSGKWPIRASDIQRALLEAGGTSPR